VASVTLDISIDEVEQPAQPVVVRAVAPRVAALDVAPPTVADEPVVDDEEQPHPEEAPAPTLPQVVQAAEPPTLVIASVEAPKVLPTPVPTLTPQQLKARADAANQAAIDAAKAAQARAKADADAANQAAIDEQKRAIAVSNVPAMADAALVLPTPTPTKTNAKTAAEGTRETAAKAKAVENAANQAAIEAAKAVKSPKH
jgi:colicin import membrane protein